MPAAAIIPYIIKYWWVAAIIVLVAWVKIDSARLHSAQTALESTKAELSVALKNNDGLKKGTDECNAKVDALNAAGTKLQDQVKSAQAAAATLQANIDQATRQRLADKPKNDCESINKYLREQTGRFTWQN